MGDHGSAEAYDDPAVITDRTAPDVLHRIEQMQRELHSLLHVVRRQAHDDAFEISDASDEDRSPLPHSSEISSSSLDRESVKVRRMVLQDVPASADFPTPRGLDMDESVSLFKCPPQARATQPELTSAAVSQAYDALYSLGHFIDRDLDAVTNFLSADDPERAAARTQVAVAFIRDWRKRALGIVADTLGVVDRCFAKDPLTRKVGKAALLIVRPKRASLSHLSAVERSLELLEQDAGKRAARQAFIARSNELAGVTDDSDKPKESKATSFGRGRGASQAGSTPAGRGQRGQQRSSTAASKVVISGEAGAGADKPPATKTE